MKKQSIYFISLSVFIVLIFYLPPCSWSQLVIGQYEDEAPFRTWNSFGFATATSLGRGETAFTLASDSSVALVNPALLPLLPKMTVTLNSSFSSALFFKYSLVNTGVLHSTENLALGIYAIDFAGIAFRLKKWTFALVAAAAESYDRPPAVAEYMENGILLYKLSLSQEGILRVMNFSAGHKINDWLYAGLGLNFCSGYLKREMTDHWERPTIDITDRISQDFRGFFLNGGFLFNISAKLRTALVFQTPYKKKSKSQSFLNYSAPARQTEITIKAASEDTYKQPFVLGIGGSYAFSQKFNLALDLTYYNWSSYSVEYFEEQLTRNFKNILKIGAGVEYINFFRLFGQRFDNPLRAGLVIDSQPMEEPNSYYLYFSLGIGIRWKNLSLDLGSFSGKEKGSGDNLSGRKVALSLSYRI